MIKCDMSKCEAELFPFGNDKTKDKGVLIHIPSINKLQMYCTKHAKEIG